MGWEDPLEEEMPIHSSILAWRIPMDRGAWLGTVHRVTKSQTQLKGLGLVSQLCPILRDPMDCNLPGSSVHRDSPGKNTGVGCHALLQGIFLTQGFPALQVDSLPDELPGKPQPPGGASGK